MKSALLIVCLLMNACLLKAGCVQSCYATVNGVNIFSCELNYSSDSVVTQGNHSGWIGHCYLTGVGGDLWGCAAHVYFRPGDTLYLSGMTDGVTAPGVYTSTVQLCSGVLTCENSFTVSYFNDTLEDYYLHHIDQQYIDSSMTALAIQQIMDDSLVQLPITFAPNPFSDKLLLVCPYAMQGPMDMMIYDMQGTLINSEQVDFATNTGSSQTLDVTALPAGLYIVRYTMNNKQYTRRIEKI